MSRHHGSFNLRRWRAIRLAVFERDGWRCLVCGRPGRLECDHVTPMQREPGQDPFDINGLQTLCVTCHIEKTARENGRELGPRAVAWQALVAEVIKD